VKKTNILTLLCFILLTSNLNGQDTSHNPFTLEPEHFNSEKIKDGLEFNDNKGNTYKIKNNKYSKGLLIRDGKKWQRHGVYYSYSSGRLTTKTTYRYGNKDGPYETYHSNGKKQFVCTYKNNMKEGKWYQYTNKGNIFEEVEYKQGKKNGIQITYHSNGKRNFVSTYVDGKRQGEKLQYNEKGKLIARSQFKDGKQIGKTIWTH
jgi:antitoxin component YwqK of YwqJK toxin-antitoxin module